MNKPAGKLAFAYETIRTLQAKLQDEEAIVMAAHTTVTRLTEKLADYEDACRQKQEIIDTESCLVADYLLLREGLEYFCVRVDEGSIRSKTTYKKFKDILEKTK